MATRRQARLLLADDEDVYRLTLRRYLELQGYDVEEAPTLEIALELLDRLSFDLVLADLRLAGIDDALGLSGMSLAKSATERGIPCIMITGYPSVEAAVTVLRKSPGQLPLADDFVPKIDGPRAVFDAVARHLAQRPLREDNQEGPSAPKPRQGLQIDLTRRRVWKNGEEVELSDLQYRLLAYACERGDAVSSHKELIKAVYDQDMTEREATEDRRLERLIWRVREKIEDNPREPRYLISAPGRGFRLVLD